ncbi:TPA: host cell division inhibitor Icd-like protein [Salmonella enterica subsp. enterica serovar Virchow]|nr:ash family protein [Salmonella enterica]ELG5707141.1 host cell division inhibitor Icd-like protein [Salmonella enterica]
MMYANVNANDSAKPKRYKPETGDNIPQITYCVEWFATADNRATWTFETSTRKGEGVFSESRKKGLPAIANPVYGYSAPAKYGVGRGNPLNIKATQTPIASFFVSCHSAHQFSGNARNLSMVALAGLPKGRPVSFVSGISTPVNVTTPLERGNSGGDSSYTKEAAIMATTPTQNPQFIWLIAAVRRDIPTITAKIHHIAAETEREARRILAPYFILSLAARPPVAEATA